MKLSKNMPSNDFTRCKTDIPARMDRLPWSRFHVLVVFALGVTWILDGLEVTIIGSIGPVLQDTRTLNLSPEHLGLMASLYLAGAVAGALIFGWLTDRLGRRFVFYTTLIIYLAGVLLSAFSWNFWSLACFRMITGFGIGGEYAAINSAIDELIPAKYRGRVDLIVNGSFWLGAALGAGASYIILDPHYFSINFGWRLGFAVGGVLGITTLFLRRHVPESPRWLITHGKAQEAAETVALIERGIEAESGCTLAPVDRSLEIHPRKAFGFVVVFKSMLGDHRSRSFLALVLMVSQAFLFNSVFFTYGLVLSRFQQVPAASTGLYLFLLSISNLMGPLLLGPFFDTVGRRVMITGTFVVSGLLLIAVAILFAMGELSAVTQTVGWMAIFFFASAAASSAYLTASEIFPLETRALAIACFYALGTAFGGVLAPWIFTRLIETGQLSMLAGGYIGAALLLIFAGLTELKFGVDSENKSLESIAKPLAAAE